MSGRNVVITGASSGIGAALARELASRGAGQVLIARRRGPLEAVARECGEHAHALVADVTDRGAVQGAVRRSIELLDHIDVWVNNAGRGIWRAPSELTDDDVDAMVRDNVKSALYGMQEVLPHFRERGRGQIVNVTSMLGRVPFATHRSAYSGAKHFLNALTAMFRDELEESEAGITVSLVSPGVVRTDFGLNALHGGPDSRQLPGSQSAEEVAEVIADVIESGREDVYTRPDAREMVLRYYESHGSNP